MPLISAPLILLSPAKSLDFAKPLSAALAAITPTQPRLLPQTAQLSGALGGLSKAQIKSLMSLSDSLAALNAERFANFDAQPDRLAIGAFEGMAYKGLDAPTLGAGELDYLQSHLRILCGLYGVLRPYDAIRPYRLEMSTKLEVGGARNLYDYWGSTLTDAVNADEHGSWVLNVASQEYAKAIKFASLANKPTVTASFPGPAVHAKQARGEMARFCCEQRVSRPEQLKAFRGTSGTWSFDAAASDDATYVFRRGAAAKPAKKEAEPKGSKRKEHDEAEEEAAPAPAASRRRAKK
jgi:cytoplasmic iron level regulating protein YaaA (DUF328/UPF0246 family)